MNTIEALLDSLGIIDRRHAEVFYPRVRDNDSVQVLKCRKSGVIYLSRDDHISPQHYVDWKAPTSRAAALEGTQDDDCRRAATLSGMVAGKSYLDIGTELGGMLELLKGVARVADGVELQNEIRNVLRDAGYTVYPNVSAVPSDKGYDVVSMFHVFEHLFDPLGTLADTRRVMKDGGTLVIEVPHARDFLFNHLDLESFKAFTFWGEHLILHTRESLTTMLGAAGFRNVSIEGVQRFPLANHLYWLRHGEPGGHKRWKNLCTEQLDQAYSGVLKEIDQTDTLIATAIK